MTYTDHTPTDRELTPPELRPPAAARRARLRDRDDSCVQCGAPTYGADYGGTCEGCAAVNGDPDALAARVLEAPREPAELPRELALRLVTTAEDRGLALRLRVAALGALQLRAPWRATRVSSERALDRLRAVGSVPSCYRPTGELTPELIEHAAPELRPYPPHALNYLRPTSPLWQCPRCGGPTRSADAPTCADGHPRETMEMLAPGAEGGALVREQDIFHAQQLAARCEQGFSWATERQRDALRRMIELSRRVREGWDGPPPPLPGIGRYVSPELERELPKLIELAKRVRAS